MTHIAMQQADDDGNVVIWGKHVTDDGYVAGPAGTAGKAGKPRARKSRKKKESPEDE